jgi:hypothetical protein
VPARSHEGYAPDLTTFGQNIYALNASWRDRVNLEDGVTESDLLIAKIGIAKSVARVFSSSKAKAWCDHADPVLKEKCQKFVERYATWSGETAHSMCAPLLD